MKDSELEKLLKAARTPERPPEYWEEFPQRVMGGLRERRAGTTTAAPDSWLGPMAWGGALALACVALGFGVGELDGRAVASVIRQEKQFRREVASAPKQLCAMMQSGRGLLWLVSDGS